MKPCANSASGQIERSAFIAPATRRSLEEIAIFVPRDITRFDAPRRLATLVVFAREMEAALTDAALVMFDKMLGAVFRRADRAHKDNVVDRAKTLDASARALLGMAKAMLDAKAKNEDQVAAVERALGWERLKTLVAATETVVIDARPDNLGEVVERYASVRRMSPVVLGAFAFRSWRENDPLLAALDVVRELHASGAKKLPPRAPTAFLRPVWRKLVKTDAGTDRRAYEVAVMMSLRERLRSGDVWVEGSRAFRAFDDFLLPRDAFENRRAGRRIGSRRSRSLRGVARHENKASGNRASARSTRSPPPANCPRPRSPRKGCRSARFAGSENEAADALVRRLYAMLPRLRVTELFAEVQAGRASPIASRICAPARRRTTRAP